MWCYTVTQYLVYYNIVLKFFYINFEIELEHEIFQAVIFKLFFLVSVNLLNSETECFKMYGDMWILWSL